MAAAGALDQNVSTAANLSALLTRLIGTGAETTTGGTTTKQTLVNPQDIMKQLLEGAGTVGYGKPSLAANIGAEKRAGLYNSSSGQLNINDLLSRVATEASIAAAPTVTNNPTVVKKQAGMMSGSGLGLGALALLAGTKAGRKKMSDTWDEFFGKDATDGFGFTKAPEGGLDFAAGYGAPDIPNIDLTVSRSLIPSATSGSIDAIDTATPTAVDAYSSNGDAMSAAAFGAGGYGALEGTVDSANAAGAAGGDAIGTLLGANSANWGLDMAGDVGWTSGADLVSAADYASVGADAAGSGIPYLSTALDVASGDYQGAAFTAIGTAVGGPIGGVIGSVVSNIVDGCFITTAILHTLGNSDDNATELKILRNYRDTWLHQHHPEDIEEYYRIAPSVVEAIDALPNANQIWRQLWRNFLSPAIHSIVQGDNEKAYNMYKAMVEVATAYSNADQTQMENV